MSSNKISLDNIKNMEIDDSHNEHNILDNNDDELTINNKTHKVNKFTEASESRVNIKVMDENQGIDIPDFDIGVIVEAGVKIKKSFFYYIKDMIYEIGLKNIFHDKNEVIFISVIVTALLGYSMFGIYENTSEISNIYRFIFIASPILYIVILLFSFFNTKQKGTFELEMSCKYNLYQMLALRMFIFSLVSIIVNTIIISLVFTWKQDINVLRAICISITGLFLFSSGFIYIAVCTKKEISKLLLVSSWVVINLGLYFVDKNIYNAFLMDVPIYIHLIVTLMCIIFYIKNLKRFINFRSERRGF